MRLRFLSKEQHEKGDKRDIKNLIHPYSYGPKFASLGIGFGMSRAMLTGNIGIHNPYSYPIEAYLYADILNQVL